MVENLSPREKELFDLLITGVSPKDIAYKLNLKPSTVDYYRTKLYNKLGIHSIQELLVKYSTNGKENTPVLAKSEPQPSLTTDKWSGVEPEVRGSPLEETINIPQIKKHKKIKFLLPVGAAFIALSVLFGWIFIKNSSDYHTPKGVIIPVTDLGFFPTSDSADGGNSTSEIFITREKIDGVTVDVLNININLEKRENSDNVFANMHTNKPDLMQRLRQANGIRFKARGNGKQWAIDFFTKESTAEGNYPHYSYFANTVMDQVIVVDVLYSSLYLAEWFEKYRFDFNKETITGMAISAINTHGYGPSFLKIFDFEIF